MIHRSDVSIVGAGMSGCVMSIYLARQQHRVDLFERRPDIRTQSLRAGRSINLTLAARAISTLEELGLLDRVLDRTVPLLGRMVHKANGRCVFQSYGNAPYDKIYSITRGLLNSILLDAVSEESNVSLHFDHNCVGIDKENRLVSMRNNASGEVLQVAPGLLIGADGGFSTIREALHRGEIASHNHEFQGWGYKEIFFPPLADGSHSMDGNVLHIWPRGNCVLLAMPNPDGSFTGTLCMPFEGPVSMRSLSDPDTFHRFCEAEFPDALRLAPGMVDDLCTTTPSGFLTVSTDPWYYKDWAVLVGDACHTVLPFYGQGMNAAFQDCTFLADQLRRNSDRRAVFLAYQNERKSNTDILAELSKTNFVELRDSVRYPVVGYRKKVDLLLNRAMPRAWTPLYTLISHTTIPYVEAVAMAERQKRILRWTGIDACLRFAGFATTLVQPKIRTDYTAIDDEKAAGRSAAAANSVGALSEPKPVAQGAAVGDSTADSFLGSESATGAQLHTQQVSAPDRMAEPAGPGGQAGLESTPDLPARDDDIRKESGTPGAGTAAAVAQARGGTWSTLVQVAKGLSMTTIVIAALAGALTGAGRAAILGVINAAISADGTDVRDYMMPFVGLALLLLGSQVLSRLLLVRLSQRVIYDLRMHLSRQILAAPLRQVEKTGTPRLLSTMIDDVGALANLLLSLPALSIHVSTILVCMLYLGWLSPIGLGSLVVVMLIGALSYQLVVKRGIDRFRQAREDQNRVFALLRSVTDGAKEFKLNANRRRDFIRGNLEPAAASYRKNSVVGNSIYSFATSWGQFVFFAYIGLLLFLVADMQNMNRDTLTGFTLVVLYVIIPLEMALTLIPQFASAKVAIENIRKAGLAPEGTGDAEAVDAPVAPLLDSWRRLEVRQVVKSYTERSGGFRLGPVSFVLHPGELLFVMGGNGSGKSTLGKLLAGLYTPDEGEIRLDDVIVDDANRERYRQMFSAVFSDFHLLDGLQGVTAGASVNRARTLLARLQLDGVVTIRNGVFSTTELSTGQRKRLALLVSLLEDRPLYVFDEWAADQDPEFKAIFYREILPELASRGKTVFAITHDDRYAGLAHRLFRLEDGAMCEVADVEEFAKLPASFVQSPATVSLAGEDDAIIVHRLVAPQSGLEGPAPGVNGILGTIGNTPMVSLDKLFGSVPFRLMAKLESANPGGSIKDRSALRIIEDAMAQGLIDRDTLVIEASSGNMGIGLAQICRYYQLHFICVVDKRTTEQNIQIMRAYGAQVEVITEPHPRTGDMLQAKLDRVDELMRTVPKAFWPNQYANSSNSRSHHATMTEIIAQCGGKVDYVFCATSTCGTLRGCVEYVREHGLSTQVVAVDAIGSVIFGGKSCHRLLPGHGTARVPELFSSDLADRFVQVSDLDCVIGCHRLLREEAILAGGSSGGVIMAVDSLRGEIPADATCVVILADRGERYLDTIYSSNWVEHHLGVTEPLAVVRPAAASALEVQ